VGVVVEVVMVTKKWVAAVAELVDLELEQVMQ
jgi:hypothetical protein